MWTGPRLAAALACAIALALGALQAAAHRQMLWIDGISYIEIGEAYAHGDWKQAVNGCWSPLYSWILGPILAGAHPPPAAELSLVKAVNFAIYMASLLAFFYFLGSLRATPPSLTWPFFVFSFVLFLWSSLIWLQVRRDTPDLCVAALVYLATGLTLRIHAGAPGRRPFILLGLVLALGYLAKSALLLLAPVFLLIAASRCRHRALLATATLMTVGAPFAAALSLAKGRPTFGDAGRLNYAWIVSPGAPDTHWQGEPAGSGTPRHPTRRVHADPDVFEFDGPVSATYPPWYDPSYWNEGLEPRFRLDRQLEVSAANLAFYARVFGPILAAAVAAVALGRRAPLPWPALLPGLAGLALYAVASDITWAKADWGYMQTRMFAPFAVVLCVGLAAAARSPASAYPLLAIALALAAKLTLGAVRDVKLLAGDSGTQTAWRVAEDLRRLGLQTGDRVAILGQQDHYWARLAGLSVIAELPDVGRFWSTTEERRRLALAAVAATGARAVVAVPMPSPELARRAGAYGFTRLGDGDYYALRLDRAPP